MRFVYNIYIIKKWKNKVYFYLRIKIKNLRRRRMEKIIDKMKKYRRDLHQIPELGYEEKKTQKKMNAKKAKGKKVKQEKDW